MRGEYLIFNKGGLIKDIIPNTIVQQGQLRIYESAYQNLTAGKSLGTLQIALIDEVPTYAGLIAGITTEPTGQGTYARQSLAPNATSWFVDSINGEGRVTSAVVTFAAVGADFSRAYSRFMLAETAKEIISYSSPISAPKTILNGQSVNVAYRMYTG